MFQTPGEVGPGSIDALAASIQGLPWAAHWVAVAAVVAGLLLWGVGRQVLKPLFCLIGGIAGGVGGFFAASLLGIEQLGTVPGPFVGLGVGGVLGMAVAASLFNFAVAVGFGVVAGLSGVLVSATVLDLHTEPRTGIDAAIGLPRERLVHIDAEHAVILAQLQTAPRGTPEAARGTPEAESSGGSLTERARALASGLGEEFRSRWDTLDPRSQFIVALAGLGGAGAGFLIGLLLPGRSAAAATALLGSAVWLTGGVWLAGALDVPGREFLDRGPKEWLIIWLSVAGVGLAVQLQGMGSGKKAE